ncbi:integrin alpha FG-GAP repeat containing protein 1 [Nematocida major]|uniref:integrin alpha FG-GAP repeat containing protein 1 n=1 Tax=Nematocida major TaxID=1912982 RepID=UPI0020085759|nr:integrin alpha FG-GAP repeat containing protein 1 [Nematocida major]KAH9387196.1 integrin alpha FG-GAP repeat containing protein 1 [Nematocida major]
MWPWKTKEEFVEFEKASLVATDFIPLAYITDSEKRKVEIAGTNTMKHGIFVVSPEKGKYEVSDRIETSFQVDYLGAIDLLKDGRREYVVFTKTPSGFDINIASISGKSRFIGESECMPFLVSHEGLNPVLFTQNSGNTYFIDLVKEKTEASSTNFGILRENHSSGFVDVSGDGIPEIVLDTLQEEGRVIEVWKRDEKEEYALVNTVGIPVEAGPFVFGDFTGSGSVDILFLSNDPPAINVVPNRRLPYCTHSIRGNCLHKKNMMEETSPYGYAENSTISYPVHSVSEFILSNESGPVFPSVLDINSNTYPDVLAVAKEEDDDSPQPRLFLNTNGDGFVPESVFSEISGSINRVSFYRQDKGVWNVLASCEENATSSLYMYPNVSDISGYYISIMTKMQRESTVSPIVGACHACRITETGRVVVGFHPAQSGYASLQSPIVNLGLGSTNVFIGSLQSRVPCRSYSVGKTFDKIVPNSELLIEISGNKPIEHSLYLNTSAYWPVAIPIMLTILFVLGITSAYFSVKARKVSKHAVQRTRYNAPFGAL